MIFRRPELEKDNPIAPEPYIGPRRRLAMARAAALEKSTESGNLKEVLRTLTSAAAEFLREQPNVRKPGRSLTALRDAIAKADQMLAVGNRSRSSNRVRR
ncbi:MAG: hypothetical protein KF876_14295 [Nitrospira sp.]|nr:hypothetical protein [Nitrospira sp.]